VPPGSRTPLSYPTASGRVLVAFSNQETVDIILAGGLRRFTSATITDPRRVRAILTGVRKNGVAVVHGEYQELLSAVAAPIFNTFHDCVGAIAISGVTRRFAGAELPELIQLVRTAAQNCSNALLGLSPEHERRPSFSSRR